MMDLERHLVAQAGRLNRFEDFFWHRLRSEYALRAIRRYVDPNPTVLDIGAGAGVFGSHFQKAFPGGRYAFVEPLESLAQGLRLRFTPSADWSGKSYIDADAAVLLDVLEHQEKDVVFLKNLIANLRPCAILIVTCPALPLLWSEWDVKLGHYRRYTLGHFRTVLEEAGLEILGSRYLFQTMVALGLVRKLQRVPSAEFPRLPDMTNRLIYRLGTLERALCGWVPFGSSVAAVCRTRPSSLSPFLPEGARWGKSVGFLPESGAAEMRGGSLIRGRLSGTFAWHRRPPERGRRDVRRCGDPLSLLTGRPSCSRRRAREDLRSA